MKVLITGGSGFIGSTIASACLDTGIQPIIVDNHSTGRREFSRDRVLYEGDIADGDVIDAVFGDHPDIAVTVHCAARIVVPESVAMPIQYFHENVTKSVRLVEHLIRNDCHRLIYSSSASIYEPGPDFSVDESSRIAPASPYARTKAIVDEMLTDIATAERIQSMSLRYFNPIGADPKLRTGLQLASPSHALGRMIGAWRTGRPFQLTGTDFPTRDGTGIRDYVHVWDLARAHVSALTRFDAVLPRFGGNSVAINLGSGSGTTVRELLDAFGAAVGAPLRVETAPRRPGDTTGVFTRSDRAAEQLDWRPELSMAEGIQHALEWNARRAAILEPSGG